MCRSEKTDLGSDTKDLNLKSVGIIVPVFHFVDRSIRIIDLNPSLVEKSSDIMGPLLDFRPHKGFQEKVWSDDDSGDSRIPLTLLLFSRRADGLSISTTNKYRTGNSLGSRIRQQRQQYYRYGR